MSQKTLRFVILVGGLILTVLQVFVDLGLSADIQKILVAATAVLTGLGIKATPLTGMLDSADVAASDITELTTAKAVQKAVAETK